MTISMGIPWLKLERFEWYKLKTLAYDSIPYMTLDFELDIRVLVEFDKSKFFLALARVARSGLRRSGGISKEEKKRLLHCVIFGGGPTGVEFSGELNDFIMKDVHERYSLVKDYIKVTLIEANEILSSFDVGLRQIGVDQWLHVPSVEDVFALSNCAGFLEQTGKPVLPALAQVAERQGKYLVEVFKRIGKQDGGKAFSAEDMSPGDPCL
ncbi:hypothetical protein F3Y22_tig00110934pilonHSYRG00006 [Hibiscus syriacus]|uniref:Uncharacterized protein n=1 Tax=Hibiscus syriacus TaxID=106335 RepID=A0A6A2ZBY7_HIBSY|nr:hypothetical protein F3Y22_tig00110934pilonHSYRG00006 [Hibiscus syriacus]